MKNLSICFGGFYESEHSGRIDGMIDSYFDEEYYHSDNINYPIIYKKYSEKYVSFLNEYLKDEFSIKSSLVFDSLESPKEYNFRTDEIIASISHEDIKSIIDVFSKHDECISFITNESKSRPGFVSFYNGYDEVIKDEIIYLQYIFKYIDTINDDDFEQYYDFNCMYELLNEVDFLSKTS